MEYASFHNGTKQTAKVDAAMMSKTNILRSHEGIDQAGSEIFVIDPNAILAAITKRTELHAIRRYDL